MRADFVCMLAAFALVGCQTPEKAATEPEPPRQLEALPAPVTATELDPHNLEKVRLGESIKAYPLGRYVDSNDPNVLHEAHTIYRREAGAAWNLNPNAPTVVPLGPVLAVADPARTPDPLPAELEQKIAEQNQIMTALIEQNEALVAELTKLNQEIADLRVRPDAANKEKVE